MPEPAPDEIVDAAESYPVLSSQRQFASGRVVDVVTDVVQMPDGGTPSRDVVVHPGAVGVIALDDDDRVLLVQQYRHPPRMLLWEPPAGLLDNAGEEPLVAAQRELYEEAGYRAADWLTLLDAFTSPGMTDEAIRIFLARGLTAVADDERFAGEHEEADMPVGWLPLDDAVGHVLAGRLHNPMAVMGILAAADARRDGWARLRPADAPWPQVSDFTGSAG